MNTFTKLIASTAAMIAALALAWIAYHGVTLRGGFSTNVDLWPKQGPINVHLKYASEY